MPGRRPGNVLRVHEELAGYVEGTPERYVPQLMDGELVEAEHLGRYWWAAALAEGRSVLDAGCGLGYGSALLSDAGALHVAAVDVAAPVVEAARAATRAAVEFTVADVGELPFSSATFGLVVCFEVIEHVEDREKVLDELARVVADDGLVVVSSPNRDIYVPGNPHHVEEYAPEELHAALASRFPHVALVRQHVLTASVVLPDAHLEPTGPGSLRPADVGKLGPLPPGAEPYTLALAGRRPLPDARTGVCLTEPVEVRRWVELFDEQRRTLQEQATASGEMEIERRAALALGARLEDAERELSEMADLRVALLEAERDREELAVDRAKVVAQRDEFFERMHVAEAMVQDQRASLSWRVTIPLRSAKRLARASRDR